MTSLTRLYRFSASHRLHVASFSEAKNTELFGKCNNPYGHGHDYTLSVTVSGEPDERTGLIVPLALLDELVEGTVLKLFRFSNLNRDVAQFRELVPTTENLALVIADILETHWAAGWEAVLTRIHVQETARNGFEVLIGEHRLEVVENQESIALHA